MIEIVNIITKLQTWDVVGTLVDVDVVGLAVVELAVVGFVVESLAVVGFVVESLAVVGFVVESLAVVGLAVVELAVVGPIHILDVLPAYNINGKNIK